MRQMEIRQIYYGMDMAMSAYDYIVEKLSSDRLFGRYEHAACQPPSRHS
jgi:hypothetical protein